MFLNLRVYKTRDDFEQFERSREGGLRDQVSLPSHTPTHVSKKDVVKGIGRGNCCLFPGSKQRLIQ